MQRGSVSAHIGLHRASKTSAAPASTPHQCRIVIGLPRQLRVSAEERKQEKQCPSHGENRSPLPFGQASTRAPFAHFPPLKERQISPIFLGSFAPAMIARMKPSPVSARRAASGAL